MTTFSQAHHASNGLFSSAARIAEILFGHPHRRRALLDARDLPDHLKRDLGFLDGKTPPGSIK